MSKWLNSREVKWAIRLIKKLPPETSFGRARPGTYLAPGGKFISHNIQIPRLFDNKREAKEYCSVVFGWGCLEDYAEVVKVKKEITFCFD